MVTGMNDSPEPYRIVSARRVRRDLERLPESVAAACIEFVQGAIANNPHRLGKALLHPFDGCFSARRGSYRIVYRINELEHTIELIRIDHRPDVYRP